MHRPTVSAGLILPLVAVLLLTACGATQTDATADATSAEPTAAVATPSPSADEPGSEPTDTGSDDEAAVNVTASSFSPGSLTVATGTAVTFTNNSPLAHTVTHGSGGQPADDAAFDEAVSEGGGTVVVTFDEPGTYEITCRLHPSMQMTITVEG